MGCQELSNEIHKLYTYVTSNLWCCWMLPSIYKHVLSFSIPIQRFCDASEGFADITFPAAGCVINPLLIDIIIQTWSWVIAGHDRHLDTIHPRVCRKLKMILSVVYSESLFGFTEDFEHLAIVVWSKQKLGSGRYL